MNKGQQVNSKGLLGPTGLVIIRITILRDGEGTESLRVPPLNALRSHQRLCSPLEAL